ncbi:MAG: anthranilate phosphoribosyltransferase [Verrucomicrobia bacterium]|nr:MAG: anthranilate phosphoribosyltransferase [Verrucomicrobiota bacterium]
MIKEAIAALVEGKGLSREEAFQAMSEIMAGEATAAQIGAFITALRIRGETPEVVAGCAAAMRTRFTAVHPPGEIVVDTCGTGGDGAHTFNISTAAAFVAAGAGAIVAKHGNRSVSSRCGSADVMAALGVKIDIDAAAMSACLREVGIAFLFAPRLHPAMKHAIGPRREIGIRSVFNILGPLSNPAGASYGVLGVFSPQLVKLVSRAALDLGARHLFVVHGTDGLDEITTTAPTLVAEVQEGQIREYEISPEDIGVARAKPEELGGGDAEENADIIREVLAGKSGPRRDIVVVNAAAAIAAAGLAPTLADAIPLAQESIDSGAAMRKLERLVEFSRACGSDT